MPSPVFRPPPCWIVVVLAVLLCAGRGASAQATPATMSPSASRPASGSQAASASLPATVPSKPLDPSEMPEPGSFKAFDRPSDDGSAILVQWGAPAKEPPGVKYVIEVARSEADFASGNFKTKVVAPSKKSLASAKPQYFGYGAENQRINFAQISPGAIFPPPEAPDLTPDRLKDLVAQHVLSGDQMVRARDALVNQTAMEEAKAAMAEAQSVLEGEAAAASSRTATATSRAVTPDPQTAPKVQVILTRAADALGKGLDALEEPRDALVRGASALEEAQAVLAKDAAFAKSPAAVIKARAALAEAAGKLTRADRTDLKWFQRLSAFLKERDQKAYDAELAKVNRQTWYFRLAVQKGGEKFYVSRDEQPVIVSASAKPNWFKWGKLNNLVFSLAFCAIVGVFIQVAKRRPGLFIRKIAGLEAVDEAIGRSTEMDRPVFFVHGGSSDMGDMATIASVNILARVAARTAEHDTRLRVMNNEPIVTAVSQEVVQQAYMQAGRPDAYNPDDVSLVASEQFAYVAAVSGSMVREQPGAIFLLGSFFAESLLLAETGASTGAIQVAGTDQYTQLPFFITTCDYTLIGEELYAASAYLSREPRLLGSLRGQDVGKAFLMIAMVVGSLALTAAVAWHANQATFWIWLRNFFSASAG